MTSRADRFPLGAAVTLAELEADAHPVLARLRASEPVSWVAAWDCWLVTGHPDAVDVMRDSATFTVDDPRFSTARVVGASMLSLDGAEHARHRAPFVAPFRPARVQHRFGADVADLARDLVARFAAAGTAELRRELAGPLSVAVVADVLGLAATDADTVLGWYAAIVEAVTTSRADQPVPTEARRAMAALTEHVHAGIAADRPGSLLAGAAGSLDEDQVVANAAVLMFGGIETTEGMILNAVRHVLDHGHVANAADPDRVAAARRGVAADGARGGGGRPLRHPRRPSSPGPRSRAATWSGSRWPAPTATPRSSRTPTCSTRTAATPARSWGSPAARTCASRWTWPGSRPGSRCTRW